MNKAQRKIVVIFTLILGIVLLGVAIDNAMHKPIKLYRTNGTTYTVGYFSFNFSYLFHDLKFYGGMVLIGASLFVFAGRRKEVK
jgi:hypothetical protein